MSTGANATPGWSYTTPFIVTTAGGTHLLNTYSNAYISTQNNVLDDGVAGNISVGGVVFGTGNTFLDMYGNYNFRAGATGSIYTIGISNSYNMLSVSYTGNVATANNTLDDGNGLIKAKTNLQSGAGMFGPMMLFLWYSADFTTSSSYARVALYEYNSPAYGGYSRSEVVNGPAYPLFSAWGSGLVPSNTTPFLGPFYPPSDDTVAWSKLRVIVRGCSLGTAGSSGDTLTGLSLDVANYLTSWTNLVTWTHRDGNADRGYTTSVSPFVSLPINDVPVLGISFAGSSKWGSTQSGFRFGQVWIQFVN